MTWVQIDDDMPRNPKVMRLSMVAFRVYIGSICYAGQNQTDGIIERPALTLIPYATLKVAKELVEAGLWEGCQGGWNIHDYLLHNRSRSQIAAATEQRRLAGKSRAATRYSGPLNGSVSGPLENTAAKASGPLPRSRDLHTLGSPSTSEEQMLKSEPLSDPLDDGLPQKVREMRDWILMRQSAKYRNDPETWEAAESFARTYQGQTEALTRAYDSCIAAGEFPGPRNLAKHMKARPEATKPRELSPVFNVPAAEDPDIVAMSQRRREKQGGALS